MAGCAALVSRRVGGGLAGRNRGEVECRHTIDAITQAGQGSSEAQAVLSLLELARFLDERGRILNRTSVMCN